jgi:L-threonylcarbamoyladenylate synthase
MPSHPAALELIKKSGVYIAAPSANTSGRPSPTKAEHVVEDMSGKIDMIIDGGEVGIGIESTIVDLTSDVPAILRPGYITKNMIENIIGPVIIDPAIINPTPDMRPKAPGMKYTHYAPKGELTVVECTPVDTNVTAGADSQHTSSRSGSSGSATSIDNYKRVANKINELVNEKISVGFRVAVIATEETKELYNSPHVLTVGSAGRGETVAAKLYAVLRQCDELSADYIYSEAFNYGELGGAIMNRLLKAAGQRVINI